MRMKKVLATGLVGIMSVAALGGCGSKDSKDAAKSDSVKMPSDPYEIVELASERTAALDSYEMNGSFNFAIDAMGTKVDAKADFNAVYFKDPMKMKMDVDVKATSGEETEDISMDMYFMNEDSTYVVYAGAEVDGKTTWQKSTLDPEDESQKPMIEALDKLSKGEKVDTFSMEDYKDCLSLDKDNNTDDATALLFTLTSDQMLDAYKKSADLLEGSGMSTDTVDSALSQYGLTTDSLFKGMGDITANMTVDTDQVYFKSISMDLAKPIQSLVDVVIDGIAQMYGEAMDTSSIKIDVSACDFTFNYDKYNEATDFELPEEAKKAEEVSTDDLTGSADTVLGGADSETSLDVE